MTFALQRSAILSKCGNFRYKLIRRWADRPMVCYIGHNPSMGDGSAEDPTTLAWGHFARLNGYGGYVAVNIYPYRTSDPQECRRWADFESNGPDWYARDVLIDNIDTIAATAVQSGIVVACWGGIARDQDFVDTIIEAIQTRGPTYPSLYCLGLTADGAPKHPMARGRNRIPRDQMFALWKASRLSQNRAMA